MLHFQELYFSFGPLKKDFLQDVFFIILPFKTDTTCTMYKSIFGTWLFTAGKTKQILRHFYITNSLTYFAIGCNASILSYVRFELVNFEARSKQFHYHTI